jgi:hypothetical protein
MNKKSVQTSSKVFWEQATSLSKPACFPDFYQEPQIQIWALGNALVEPSNAEIAT